MLEQVQQELDALAVRLGRSLTIDGVHGDLIAYSTQRDDVDAARVSTILLRRVAPEIREWEQRHVAADATDPVPVPANPRLGLSARFCLPLRRRGRHLGYLWILGSELSGEDRDALRRADALADLLDVRSRVGSAPGREVDELVGRLFGESRTEAGAQLAAAVPGLVDGTITVVAAVAARPGRGGARPLSAAEFSALAGALTPVLRAETAYVGAHVTPAHAMVVLHRRGLLGEIDEVVGKCLAGEVVLGVSEPRPLDAALEARDQALAAAELAALDPALDRHCDWSGLGPYRGLIGGQDDPLAPLDTPMLVETLETYLDLGGDVQATSARLNLHRSSLYYRLDRISRLLGRDLSDGLVRLDLHLALKIRRLRRR